MDILKLNVNLIFKNDIMLLNVNFVVYFTSNFYLSPYQECTSHFKNIYSDIKLS